MSITYAAFFALISIQTLYLVNWVILIFRWRVVFLTDTVAIVAQSVLGIYLFANWVPS
jgi:hypothetical protein